MGALASAGPTTKKLEKPTYFFKNLHTYVEWHASTAVVPRLIQAPLPRNHDLTFCFRKFASIERLAILDVHFIGTSICEKIKMKYNIVDTHGGEGS